MTLAQSSHLQQTCDNIVRKRS